MSTTKLAEALHRAFSLGQNYWQQADSESYAQNNKADLTRQRFLTLVADTCASYESRAEAKPAPPFTPEERKALEKWVAAAPAAPAAPVQVPLTDEQIDRVIGHPACWTGPGLGASFKKKVFARLIEQAHGIAANKGEQT